MNFQDLISSSEQALEEVPTQKYSEQLEVQKRKLAKAKRHRSENVSERDKVLFLNLLTPKVDYIENRKLCSSSKLQVWKEIELEFNTEAEVERTYDQLKELWKRLKLATKKEIEINKQKGITQLPSSIAKTFTMLKDIEYADDVCNSNNNNNPAYESSKNTSVCSTDEANGSTEHSTEVHKSESPELNFINAIHISNLLRQQEVKSWMERFNAHELPLFTSASCSGEHPEQGLDLRVQPVSTNHSDGEEDTSDQLVSSNSYESGEDLKFGDHPNWDRGHSDQQRNSVINKFLAQMDSVPNLLSLKNALGSNVMHDQFNKRRRIEVDSAATVGNACDSAKLILQRLQNEQDKNKLIREQLENEKLKKELFHVLLYKVKNNEAVSSQLLRSIFL